MKAADTNIVVRFLTVDDPRQSEIAADCIRAGLFIPHTVLIETEWVLRSVYRWTARRINAEMTDLLALQSVEVDQRDALYWALDRHRHGADWADMLHVIASGGHNAFLTFETGMIKAAGPDSPVPIEVPK